MPCLANGPARASPSVTHLKSNAVFEVLANRSEPKARNVLADQTILFIGSPTDYPYLLRRLMATVQPGCHATPKSFKFIDN
ncbi:hypothetical protein DFAR_3170029 [Desulfarculales bacterium]